MDILVHIFLFLFSASVIWYFSGIVIEAVDRIARGFNKNGFVVAFFILGFLTSIGEISVAFNSTIEGVPQIAVGNLVGASFILLLGIVPVLAILSNGIELKNTLTKRNLLLALIVVSLPSLFVIDSNVTKEEGIVALIIYATLLFAIRNQPSKLKKVKISAEEILKRKPVFNSIKIIIGACLIFLAGNLLVDQSVYFAELLSIPKSLVGLLLLSIGTNIPELVIAVRAVLHKKKGIAFGDYLGSAVINTPIFAFLAIANGGFTLATNEFVFTSALIVLGLICFYIFARSKRTISRGEGVILLLFYFSLLATQIYRVIAG